jgi:hypothetical protein
LTTHRQRRANHANAKSSTGPKTARGKARSAQNAWRHGLNVSVLTDPALASFAEAMARRIAGPDADAEALEQARRIAEAQVDVNRVRDRRRCLISGLLTDPSYQPLRALRQQLRRMKEIDRMERFRGAPFEIDEIEEMIYLEPPRTRRKIRGHHRGESVPACRTRSIRTTRFVETTVRDPQSRCERLPPHLGQIRTTR